MTFTNRISQVIHEEHRATIALMERLERLLVRHRSGPPDIAAAGVAQLLTDLATGVEADVRRHFDFEECRLFARTAGEFGRQRAFAAGGCELSKFWYITLPPCPPNRPPKAAAAPLTSSIS